MGRNVTWEVLLQKINNNNNNVQYFYSSVIGSAFVMQFCIMVPNDIVTD